jgi:hypothetical protein
MNGRRIYSLGWFLLLVGTVSAQSTAGSAGNQGSVPDTGARPGPRDPRSTVPLVAPNNVLVTSTPKLSPVFFPAPVPVLDAPLPPAPTVRDAIWAELAPYGNELFFAPLGTRLSSGELSRKARSMLEKYRDGKAAILADLRKTLAMPAAERPAALAALRARTDPRLADLERVADDLRRELYRGGFLASNADWNAYRNWRLGEESARTAQEQLYDEFSVLRAAIYYQEGLSLDQRHLLREIVLERAEAIGDRPPAGEGFEVEQTVFFLPHGSRLKVASDWPSEIAGAFAEFTAKKEALKRELRTALFDLDREGTGKREKVLQELAAKQGPAFAELEAQAEAIRVRLATVAAAERTPAGGVLPAELAARINRYLADKAELQRAAQQVQEPGRKGRPAATDRNALAEFEEQHRTKLAALAAEARAIRTEVARVSAETGGKTVDTLLADFAEAFRLQQVRTLYGDYRTAMLAPGIAPRLRQLLFDAAVAVFDVPGTKEWQAVPE